MISIIYLLADCAWMILFAINQDLDCMIVAMLWMILAEITFQRNTNNKE